MLSIPSNKESFKIEHQYKLYKQRMGLEGKELSKIQEQETRRAFMGGMSQMLFLFLEDIGALEENTAMATIEKIKNDMLKFWQNEKN